MADGQKVNYQTAVLEASKYEEKNVRLDRSIGQLRRATDEARRKISISRGVDQVTRIIADVQRDEIAIVDCLLASQLKEIPLLLNCAVYGQESSQMTNTVMNPFSESVQKRAKLISDFKSLQADINSLEDNEINLQENAKETDFSRKMRSKNQRLIGLRLQYEEAQVQIFKKISDSDDPLVKQIASRLCIFGDKFNKEVCKGAQRPSRVKLPPGIETDGVHSAECDGTDELRKLGTKVQEETIDQLSNELQTILQLLENLKKADQ